LGTTWSRKHAA